MSKKANNNQGMIPSHTFEKTSDKNIERLVDRWGDWEYYRIVKEKRLVPAVNHILHLGYAKGPNFLNYLLSVTKEEAKRKLEMAGDEGSRTHSAIRDLMKGVKITQLTKYPSELQMGRQDVLNPDEWDNLVAWMAFVEKYDMQVIDFEFPVYSAHSSFAGTADALVTLMVPSADKVFPKELWGKRVLFLPDWKTSATVYDEYKAQTAAYWQAIKESGKYDKFIDSFKGRIFTGVVRLGTRHKNGGYELVVWDENTTNKHFELFSAAKVIFEESEPECKVDITYVPSEFVIKLPKAKVEGRKKSARTSKK